MGHYGPVSLKSDQDSSLKELLKRVAEKRESRTILEEAKRSDSQSHGRAERAVRSIEEMTRVFKRDLEIRMGADLDIDSAMFDWLVRHAADLLNKRHVGKDGRTAYERMRGRPYRGELLAFGTPILHRISGKVQGGVLVDRWNEGLWLGKAASSDEHLVSTTVGTVVRARCVKATGRSPTLA